MIEVMHVRNGEVLYLDKDERPCVRIVESYGLLEKTGDKISRVGGSGYVIERYVDDVWQYAEGPFFGTLAGISPRIIEAAKRIAA